MNIEILQKGQALMDRISILNKTIGALEKMRSASVQILEYEDGNPDFSYSVFKQDNSFVTCEAIPSKYAQRSAQFVNDILQDFIDERDAAIVEFGEL